MIGGASWAYFTVVRVSSISPTVDVNAATTNYILFETGKPINIHATKDNFSNNMGNISSNTFAQAFIKANDSSAPMSINYNLYLDILDNDFVYSTENNDAELLFSIKDPDGNEITQIDGLDYVTINGVSGFDITIKKGRFYITKNHPITTTSEKYDRWDATVTFVNLNVSQDINYEKNLKGYILIEKAE